MPANAAAVRIGRAEAGGSASEFQIIRFESPAGYPPCPMQDRDSPERSSAPTRRAFGH
jgi:hypothetical protein